MFTWKKWCVLLICMLLLVACGGGEEPAATEGDNSDSNTAETDTSASDSADSENADVADEVAEEPTAEPTEEPAPEPTEASADEAMTEDGGDEAMAEDGSDEAMADEDAAMDDSADADMADESHMMDVDTSMLTEIVSVDGAGFTFKHPADWAVDVESFDGEGAELTVPGADDIMGPFVSLFGGPYDEDLTSYADMQEQMAANVAETFDTYDGPIEFTTDTLDGFMYTFSIEVQDIKQVGQFIALGNADQAVVVTMMGGEELLTQDVMDIGLAMAHTVTVFEPIVVEEVMDDAAADAGDSQGGTDAAAEGSDETTDAAATDDAADAGDEAVVELTLSAADPGIACFGTHGEGLTCLAADGTWQQFTEGNSPLGGDWISAIDDCNGTSLLIAHSSGISQYDGDTWTEYDDGWGFSTPESMACDANGGLWVAHFEGVSYFADNTWTTYSSELLGDESLVYDVEVAENGDVWVLTSNTVTQFDGTDWNVFSEGNGMDDNYFMEDMEIAADGIIWVSYGDGFLLYEDGVWNERDSGDWLTANTMALGDGLNWLGTFSSGIYQFDGANWSTIDRSNSDLSTDSITAMWADGQGRFWVGTEFGMNVFDGAWTTYLMSNSDLLNHEISAVGVLYGGPTLAPLMEKADGSLVGSAALDDGTVIANASIEICVESIYSSFDGETPCADQPFFLQETTDDAGEFAFDAVPAGQYMVVLQIDGGGWVQLEGEWGFGSQMVIVSEGETTNIGEIVVTLEEE